MLIGKVVVKYNKNTKKLYTIFQPSIESVKMIQNPEILCEKNEKSITKYIQESVAGWFEKVDQVVLSDEDKKEIKVIKESCKNYSTGELKEGIFQIVQEIVNIPKINL